MKIGQRTVISMNDGHAALRIARHRSSPDKVHVYIHQCGIEEAAGPMPPLPVAQGWIPAGEAGTLFKALGKAARA
jgi:hypothetical protein